MDYLARLSVICCCLLLTGTASAAQVYKCVGADGNISFSNNPYCPQVQAYAKNRKEPLLQINPIQVATTPALEKIELHYDRVDLADLVETIGDVAGIRFESIALEGKYIKLHRKPTPWANILNELALEYQLDYRKAYDKVYVYQIGTMGETIVHSPDMLRWYQSADTWDIVLKHDAIMMAMKAYEDSTLQDRLPNLLRRVREDLGEQAHTNAAESVTLKETSSAGVGGAIAAARSQREINERERALEEERRRKIIQRRQSNSDQRQRNSQSRCFSSSGAGC
jgi:hypothetical protein